ncbi:MAG TPA: hypothetical protein VMX36_09170 [Sedimentisphaerales bacterium]|nr:hypothetical protein [Sedimentisphaerales bacterium]
METEKKTKPNKLVLSNVEWSQFQGPNYPQKGKTEARYRIFEAGRRWTIDDREDGRYTTRPSSIIHHPSCHVCALPAGEDREKSFGVPANQPDEAKNLLDGKLGDLVKLNLVKRVSYQHVSKEFLLPDVRNVFNS